MREKERIPRIVELIGQLWDKFPDMRLGQLLENFVPLDWFTEDDQTEATLIGVIKFYNNVEAKNEKFIKARKAKSRKV